jgi:hypothetical protein
MSEIPDYLQRDIVHIEHPHHWDRDVCCLKHYPPDRHGGPDKYGFLIRDSHYKYTIFLGNIFGLGGVSLADLPTEKYESGRAMIEAGWMVD